MMKVRVVMPFRDKHKKVVYQKGQEIEVTEERYKELTTTALGPFVESASQQPPAEKPKEGEKPKEDGKPKDKKKDDKKKDAKK